MRLIMNVISLIKCKVHQDISIFEPENLGVFYVLYLKQFTWRNSAEKQLYTFSCRGLCNRRKQQTEFQSIRVFDYAVNLIRDFTMTITHQGFIIRVEKC